MKWILKELKELLVMRPRQFMMRAWFPFTRKNVPVWESHLARLSTIASGRQSWGMHPKRWQKFASWVIGSSTIFCYTTSLIVKPTSKKNHRWWTQSVHVWQLTQATTHTRFQKSSRTTIIYPTGIPNTAKDLVKVGSINTVWLMLLVMQWTSTPYQS